MQQISIEQASNTFNKLINLVIKGEDIVITKNQIPIARIVSLFNRKKKIKAGSAKGLIKIADDFDEPLDDFKEYM